MDMAGYPPKGKRAERGEWIRSLESASKNMAIYSGMNTQGPDTHGQCLQGSPGVSILC